MHVNFRSVDLQSPDRAVVTVRERWIDKLYSFSSDFPNYDELVIGERGPYDLDVTYNLERVTESWGVIWKVTQAQYANQPPGW